MITYDVNELASMSRQYNEWLERHWCDCIQMKKDHPDCFDDDTGWTRADGHACICYGRDEYDECHLAEIHDDGRIVIHYGDRTLTLPAVDDDVDETANEGLPLFNRIRSGEPFITHDDLTWVGDDCDYYGPCLYFIQYLTTL